MRMSPLVTDRYALYEAAVQSIDYDLDYAERLFRRLRRRPLRLLREDFCGTAGLAVGFVLRHRDNRAWAVDIDPEPLDWGRRYRLGQLKEGGDRVHLVQADVRRAYEAGVPRVDAILAYNFSYWVFQTRDALRGYFEAARAGLKRDGVLLLATHGGTEATKVLVEKRRIPSKQAVDGLKLPAFRYIWEHEWFNPVTHRIKCSIHFEVPGRRPMKRAFRYDWRVWTLPELSELLREAGFRESRVYVEGWDDEKREPDGVHRRRTYFENQESWIGLVAGLA